MTWGFYFDVERQEKFSFENTIFLNELTEEEKVAILTQDERTQTTQTDKKQEQTDKKQEQTDKKQEQINRLIEKNITEQGDDYIRDIFENAFIKTAACIYLIYLIY
jgi:hypothetical protein